MWALLGHVRLHRRGPDWGGGRSGSRLGQQKSRVAYGS